MLKKQSQPPAPAGGYLLQAIIFANGEFEPPPDLQERLAGADLIIAADGGSQYCALLGLRPDVIIGDLDSISDEARADWEADGVQIISHPAEKDQTDLELALRHAKEASAEKITVLGGFGRRWDQSFANMLLAAHAQFDALDIVYLHSDQQLFIIKNKKQLQGVAGERISLLPLGGDVEGVTTRGLKYSLKRETLQFGSSRGVSNVVQSDDVEIDIKSGILLCIITSADQE